MKIVLTGGHLTPAYAFAEVAHDHGDELLMIGSAGATSSEAQELNRLQVDYRQIFPVKFDRNHRFFSCLRFSIFIIPFLQSLHYLKTYKPDVVVTFGSFNAIPVAFAARCLHIPFVIHEQTRAIGLANKILVPLATSIAVSYESTKKYVHRHAITVTGNILRKAIWFPPINLSIPFNVSKPILYVTGGNQGSQIIMDTILPLIQTWKETYQLVIQYGKTTINPVIQSNEIWAKPWFSAEETSWLLHHAHIVISRGGANTIAELMVVGVPSIIVPLPNTTNDEQVKNALLLTDSNAGIKIDQSLITSTTLQHAIDTVEQHYSLMSQAAKQLRVHQQSDAANKLYQLVASIPNQT